MGTGRPREFDRKAIVARILEHVRAGNSANSICTGKDGMPTESTFRYWLSEDKDLSADYARAREARGQHYGERVADLAAKVERGEIDPQAAKVAIDAYKWASGRMAPKDFGDNQQLQVTGGGGGPVLLRLDTKLGGDDDGE